MTTAADANVITPARQIAASVVGATFNSLHQYLESLQHTNEQGQALTTTPLQYAHQRLEEASFWAVKHVLMFGPPPKPDQSATPAPASVDPPTQPTDGSVNPA